jgi:hypothetical protein
MRDVMPVIPPGQLVFGLQLPVAAQSRIFVQPWEREAGPAAAWPSLPRSEDAAPHIKGTGGLGNVRRAW